MPQLTTGTITIWRHSFGFITPDGGGANVFVLGGRFFVGDRVRFATVPNDRRPGQLMAVDIDVVGHGPLPAQRSAGRATTTNWTNFAGGGWRRAT